MKSSGYRSEVFNLCNKLKDKEAAKKISSLIFDISHVEEDQNMGCIKRNAHGDFAYVAKRCNNQFHGFLFVDDNVNTMHLPRPSKIEKLSDNERFIIEQGHKTLIRFIDLCTNDLKKKSSLLSDAINPYFLFKDVNNIAPAKSIVNDEDLNLVVDAFKGGKIYQFLLESDTTEILSALDISKMQQLVLCVEREMKKSFGSTVSHEIRKFVSSVADQHTNISDIMFALIILVYALKESLRMACQLFYEAICGGDLMVLNNQNIINIEKKHCDIIGEKYKVLVQDVGLKDMSRNIGSVVLMDCDPTDASHIHDFGMITAFTESFACDMGNTIKFSFLTVDDELINIHALTETITDFMICR